MFVYRLVVWARHGCRSYRSHVLMHFIYPTFHIMITTNDCGTCMHCNPNCVHTFTHKWTVNDSTCLISLVAELVFVHWFLHCECLCTYVFTSKCMWRQSAHTAMFLDLNGKHICSNRRLSLKLVSKFWIEL